MELKIERFNLTSTFFRYSYVQVIMCISLQLHVRITLQMVSALNVPGHRVQPASQQFSTVPQFAREVGVALQACLKDHKPGSLVYRSTVTMRNNFVKVPTQDNTPPHS